MAKPAPDHAQALREHLLYLLRGGGAHAHFEDVVADWPLKLRGVKPAGLPYSGWQLLEHMRIAQWDILDFCVNPNYRELQWPDKYWPPQEAPPARTAWDQSVKSFATDLEAMERLVADPNTDLFAPIPHGSGQTLLREALLLADHNAYHLGQLVTVRRLVGAWKG
jgi:hypothetical protein